MPLTITIGPILLYILAALAGGGIGYFIGSFFGERAGELTGAALMETTISHVAPDLYPELIKRSKEHSADSAAFHLKYGGHDVQS